MRRPIDKPKLVTVRNLPPKVARAIQARASRNRSSFNQAVIALLEERVGAREKDEPAPVYGDLDDLAGAWSKREGAGFDEALRRQRSIDTSLWK